MNREGDAGTGQGYGVRDRGFMGNEPVRLGGGGENQKQRWKGGGGGSGTRTGPMGDLRAGRAGRRIGVKIKLGLHGGRGSIRARIRAGRSC